MAESTEITVREPNQLVAGGKVEGIVPQSLEEAYRLAKAMHSSGMAPSSLNSTEKVLVAIMAGAEIGLAPFQASQAFAVINNRPVLWGDAMLAVVLRNGFKVEEWFDNDDAPTKAFCRVTRPDSGQVIERTYSLDDAKKANLLTKTGPWTTNQKRMLQMRARAFACRDGAADALKGFQMREEVEDYPKEAPATTGVLARLQQNEDARPEGFSAQRAIEDASEIEPAEVIDVILEGDQIPSFDPEAGEVHEDGPAEPQESPVAAESAPAATDPPETFDAAQWAADAHRHALELTDAEAVTAWWKLPDTEAKFRALDAYSNGLAAQLRSAVSKHRNELKKGSAQ